MMYHTEHVEHCFEAKQEWDIELKINEQLGEKTTFHAIPSRDYVQQIWAMTTWFVYSKFDD